MTILEYYIKQQSIDIWYEKFISSSNKQSGKSFSYVNTNYRNLLSFLIQFDRFRSKVGIERKDWNDKLPGGQELDKHRISNLILSGFIRKEDTYYYYTPKGVAALDLIDKNYGDSIKWILLYLLLLDYKSENRNCDIIHTTKDLFSKLQSIGYTNECILNSLRKIIKVTDKIKLFNEDIFWLISFVNDEDFIKMYKNSSEQEKNDLKDFVINRSKDEHSTDLIAHKYTPGGIYSGIMFREDVKVFYYTYKIIGILSEPFDSFINEIIKVYCEDFCSENDADIIKEFISSHKSIYIKVKQELLMGVK